jgi:hypothetical protein
MHCISEYKHVEQVPHHTSSVDTKGGCNLAHHSALSPLHYCHAGRCLNDLSINQNQKQLFVYWVAIGSVPFPRLSQLVLLILATWRTTWLVNIHLDFRGRVSKMHFESLVPKLGWNIPQINQIKSYFIKFNCKAVQLPQWEKTYTRLLPYRPLQIYTTSSFALSLFRSNALWCLCNLTRRDSRNITAQNKTGKLRSRCNLCQSPCPSPLVQTVWFIRI